MPSSVLHVEDLTKIYRNRRGDTLTVDKVSFSVEAGEVVGLLGPNGAGKTTVIKCICNLICPTTGGIWLDGVAALSHPRAALEKVAAVLEGNRNIYWRLNVQENLEFFAGLQGIPMRRIRSYIDQLIQLFNLSEKRKTPARMLSRGMQQKLAVACALVKQTPLLLLDEPTLGLDVETSYELRLLLKEMAACGERTILLSSHDMNVVQDICQRVIVINHGRVVTDDRVANLLELFRAQAYTIELSGRLNPEEAEALQRHFELMKISPDTQRTTIEVELLQNGQLYELIDLLRRSGVTIESIGRRDPNLEEIFLKIIRGKES
jgi:ABC-2 type transport system ATP-binding protein